MFSDLLRHSVGQIPSHLSLQNNEKFNFHEQNVISSKSAIAVKGYLFA
jgi:hypothetical protein